MKLVYIWTKTDRPTKNRRLWSVFIATKISGNGHFRWLAMHSVNTRQIRTHLRHSVVHYQHSFSQLQKLRAKRDNSLKCIISLCLHSAHWFFTFMLVCKQGLMYKQKLVAREEGQITGKFISCSLKEHTNQILLVIGLTAITNKTHS